MIRKNELGRVIVFGGTTEGRVIAEALNQIGQLICVCVATEYGESFLEKGIYVRVGRLEQNQMEEMIKNDLPDCVIDATHPYATVVTENIKEACEKTNTRYIRVERENKNIDVYENVYKFTSMDEMISWVELQEGTIFSTLGVKEVETIKTLTDYKRRVVVRVLPAQLSLDTCKAAGFEDSHIIAATGPFSYEQNVEHFTEKKANILLTKESGKAGGFEEKIKAAKDCKMKIGILLRPQKDDMQNSLTVDELLNVLKMEK